MTDSAGSLTLNVYSSVDFSSSWINFSAAIDAESAEEFLVMSKC